MIIIDGTALVLRPWFVGNDAPWAVARNKVRRVMRETTHLAVVVDRTLDTFRREIDPAYKANRPPPPPELIAHFDQFEAEVTKMGVCLFGSQTVEADDLAATLVRLAAPAALPVVIQADDKDLFQLVRDTPPVIIEDTKRGVRYDRAGVKEKLGVEPEQVVDYLSLVGDKVDGIPGVAGVGAKTAAALLAAMGTLDSIFANLEQVEKLPIRGARTLGQKLETGRKAALHARRLIQLVDDVDLGKNPIDQCER